MTPNAAKKLIAAELARLGISVNKLTARTINFSDLARATCVFVQLHGWTPNPAWTELETIARANGFRIET